MLTQLIASQQRTTGVKQGMICVHKNVREEFQERDRLGKAEGQKHILHTSSSPIVSTRIQVCSKYFSGI